MTADILLAIGGVGLFLLGMTLLTGGLRELAGPALRRMLARLTRSPWRGAAVGALSTAVVQSSHATIVAAVGFVSAGLLTFPEGLGIVFGANIGTTITGWLVALLGFRFDLGTAVMPLVLAGVLMRMFLGRRLGAAGWAMAGFGVLFIGIDAMQNGMAGFEGAVTPERFPADTLPGRLLLVLIGIAITTVTQSSSAGVAMALTAIAAGAISFQQAAAMVIGMDIATSFTAALAVIGASTATRRTGIAHVVFNLMTGVAAFLLLVPYVRLVEPWLAGAGTGAAQIALVGFHTAFNLAGVLLVLPVAAPFARLVERIVPERGAPLTARLEASLLQDAELAMAAATATMRDIAEYLVALLGDQLAGAAGGPSADGRVREALDALQETRAYIERIPSDPARPRFQARYAATMHLLDHLVRLAHRCGQEERIAALGGEHRLHRLAGVLRAGCAGLLDGRIDADDEARSDRVRRLLRDRRDGYRDATVLALVRGEIAADEAFARLDGIRWLHRVSYHLWRVAHYLPRLEDPAALDLAPIVAELEPD